MRSGSQLVLKDSGFTKPSTLREYLGELKKSDSVSGYLYIAARDAQFVDFPETLDVRIRAALDCRGIRRLYSHQLQSFNLARAGKNVVVVTPTASGKTLCYNLPVLQKIV